MTDYTKIADLLEQLAKEFRGEASEPESEQEEEKPARRRRADPEPEQEEKPTRRRRADPEPEQEEKPTRRRRADPEPEQEEEEKPTRRRRAEPEQEKKSGPTLADVRRVSSKLIALRKRDVLQEILSDFDSKDLSDLAEKDYEEFIREVEFELK